MFLYPVELIAIEVLAASAKKAVANQRWLLKLKKAGPASLGCELAARNTRHEQMFSALPRETAGHRHIIDAPTPRPPVQDAACPVGFAPRPIIAQHLPETWPCMAAGRSDNRSRSSSAQPATIPRASRCDCL